MEILKYGFNKSRFISHFFTLSHFLASLPLSLFNYFSFTVATQVATLHTGLSTHISGYHLLKNKILFHRLKEKFIPIIFFFVWRLIVAVELVQIYSRPSVSYPHQKLIPKFYQRIEQGFNSYPPSLLKLNSITILSPNIF